LPEELQAHPSQEAIFQRMTNLDQEIQNAQKSVHEPQEHVIKTTGYGIDWEDVERQAKLALGRKFLGGK